MAKPRSKSQHLLKRYSVEDLDARPVTSKDKWCYRPALKNGHPLKEGDWGYIITLPSVPKTHSVFEGLQGYSIIRTKKVNGQFLLQIILTCCDNHYAISSRANKNTNSKKKRKGSKSKCPYILSIQNWG